MGTAKDQIDDHQTREADRMAFKEQCAACPEIASHVVLLCPWDEEAEVATGEETLNEKTTLQEMKVCNDCLHTLEVGMEPLKVGGVEYAMWGYRRKIRP